MDCMSFTPQMELVHDMWLVVVVLFFSLRLRAFEVLCTVLFFSIQMYSSCLICILFQIIRNLSPCRQATFGKVKASAKYKQWPSSSDGRLTVQISFHYKFWYIWTSVKPVLPFLAVLSGINVYHCVSVWMPASSFYFYTYTWNCHLFQ